MLLLLAALAERRRAPRHPTLRPEHSFGGQELVLRLSALRDIALLHSDERMLINAADILDAVIHAFDTNDAGWLQKRAAGTRKYANPRSPTPTPKGEGERRVRSLPSRPVLNQEDEGRHLVGLVRCVLSFEGPIMAPDFAAQMIEGALHVGVQRCPTVWRQRAGTADERRRRSVSEGVRAKARERIAAELVRLDFSADDRVIQEADIASLITMYLRAIGVDPRTASNLFRG